MDKTTKTKIIVFASFGIFVLVVLAVVLALAVLMKKKTCRA